MAMAGEVQPGGEKDSRVKVAKEGKKLQGEEEESEVSAGNQVLKVAKGAEEATEGLNVAKTRMEQQGGDEDAGNLIKKVDGFVDVDEDGNLAMATKRPAVSPTSPNPKEKFRRVRQVKDSSSSESQEDDDDESQALDIRDSSIFIPGPAPQLGDGVRLINPSLQNVDSQDN